MEHPLALLSLPLALERVVLKREWLRMEDVDGFEPTTSGIRAARGRREGDHFET